MHIKCSKLLSLCQQLPGQQCPRRGKEVLVASLHALTDYCDPKNGTVAGDSESRDNGWTRMSLKLVLIMVLQAASLSLLPAVG